VPAAKARTPRRDWQVDEVKDIMQARLRRRPRAGLGRGCSALRTAGRSRSPKCLRRARTLRCWRTRRSCSGAAIIARVRVLVASPQSAAPSLPASLPPPGRRRPVSSGVPSRSEGRRLPGPPSPEDPRPRPHPDGGPCARRNMWWRNCKMKLVCAFVIIVVLVRGAESLCGVGWGGGGVRARDQTRTRAGQ